MLSSYRQKEMVERRRNACCTTCVFLFFLVNCGLGLYYYASFKPTMTQRKLALRSDDPMSKFASVHGSQVAADFSGQHEGHEEGLMPFVRVAMSVWRPFILSGDEKGRPLRRSLCNVNVPVAFSNSMASNATLARVFGVGQGVVPTALIPPQLLIDFTLNGTLKVTHRFRNESGTAVAAGLGGRARRFRRGVLQAVYKELLELESAEHSPSKLRGQEAQMQLVKLFRDLAPTITNKSEPILLIGTLDYPVIEVAALAYLKAPHALVVDQRPAWYEDRRLSGLSQDELWNLLPNSTAKQHEQLNQSSCFTTGQKEAFSHQGSHEGGDVWRARKQAMEKIPRDGRFDVIVSYSAVQHDGLGRYGDALDPYGDVMAVAEMYTLLRPGGRLILAVPIGNDCLSFNTHRVYGRRRLGLLIFPWVVDRAVDFSTPPSSAGGAKIGLFEKSSCDGSFQSHRLLVLRKPQRSRQRLVYDSEFAGQWAATERAKIAGLVGPLPMTIG